MKVLIASGDSGGPATYTQLLKQSLPNKGIEVDVASFQSVISLPPGVRHIVYFFKLLKQTKNVDVIYAQDPFSVGYPAMLVSKIRKKKLFLKVVGDYAWEQGQVRFGVTEKLDSFVRDLPRRRPFFVSFLVLIERTVARNAYKIIVPSEYLKKIVTLWGIPKKNITVIFNSPGDLQPSGNRETLRGLLQFDGQLVVSVGRLVPWKGFKDLIDVAPNLHDKYPRMKLLIVGGGPMHDELKESVRRRGMEEYVVVTGHLDHDVTLRYIEAADLFVLNSSYEGFSHTLLETMAIGTPIVATTAGGNPELIRSGTDGVLVTFGDKKGLEEAIGSLLKDSKRAKKLAQSGSVRVRQYDVESMLQSVTKVLQS